MFGIIIREYYKSLQINQLNNPQKQSKHCFTAMLIFFIINYAIIFIGVDTMDRPILNKDLDSNESLNNES